MSPNSLQNTPSLTADEKNWAMLCHLSSLLGFVLVPSANLWAPLVMWLIKRNESRFVDENGKDAVNFHLSLWIYTAVAGLACWVMLFTVILIVLIPFVLVFFGVLYVMGVVCSIIGAVKASNGEIYRYPMTMRLIS